MGFFDAIARRWKLFWAGVTGQIEEGNDGLVNDVHVARAEFDDIIAAKRERYQRLSGVTASLEYRRTQKEGELKALEEEIAEIERDLDGAVVEGQEILARYGGDLAQAKLDKDYMDASQFLQDYSDTVKEKKLRVAEIEEALEELAERLDENDLMLKEAAREIQKIADEREMHISDIMSAQETKELNDLMAGVGETDSANGRLEALRAARGKAKAEAEISRRISGADTKRQRSRYRRKAAARQGSDAFDALVLADKAADSAASETATPAATEKRRAVDG